MLRYYEQEKLLRPGRTSSGYRIYGEGDVATARRILLLNGAGLRLTTIRGLLACSLSGPDGFEPCQALKNSVRQKLAELDGQIAALSESRRLLSSLVTPRGDLRQV